MNAQQKKKLKRLINECAEAEAAAFRASNALNDLCEEIWGFIPGDRDVDSILDAVYGGCGEASGMSTEDFIAAMENSK